MYLRVAADGVLEFSETAGGDAYLRDVDPATTGDQTLTITPSTLIRVELAGGDDTLIIQFSDSIDLEFEGGAGDDTLVGPEIASAWGIIGANAGTLNSRISFRGVENLTGAAGNEDTFFFEAGGSLSGLAEGGAGGFDSVVLDGGTFDQVTYTATGPDSGTISRDDDVITYAGMEPVTSNDVTAANVEFNGTAIADRVTLKRVNGRLTIESDNNLASFESVDFDDPSDSLTINLGFNVILTEEHVFLENLGDFNADLTIDGGGGPDKVVFKGDLNLIGHNLTVKAERVEVQANVTISTRQIASGGDHATAASMGNSGNIIFEAKSESAVIDTLVPATICIGSGAKLLAHGTNAFSGGDISITAEDVEHRLFQFSPVEIAHKTASITLGSATDGATLKGRNVTVRAYAADRPLLNELPVYAKGFVGEIMGYLNQLGSIAISQFLGIDASVFIRAADATVDLFGDTLIDATGNVDIEAKSIADASLWAVAVGPGLSPVPFTAAVGYGESTALTRAKIADTSEITATGNVTILSDASAIAAISARTNAQLGKLGPGGLQDVSSKNVSVAFAFAKTDLDSTATVAEGATIVSREGNVNVDAKGAVTNNPTAWTAQYGDGAGGIGVALGFDDSDVTAQVDGTVKAKGVAGPTFDPQASGIVSVSADTIKIDGHGYSSGDQVVYSAGKDPFAVGGLGTPVGGLEDGGTYTILVVDGDHIQLASGGHIDLDNSAVNSGAVHSLTPFGLKTFRPATSGVVNTDADTIRIDGHGFSQGQLVTYSADGAFEKDFEPSAPDVIDHVNNTIRIDDHGFVDGDRVLYDSNDSDGVPGLVDGKEYEVDLDSLPVGDQSDKLKLIDPDDGTVVDVLPGTQPEGAHHLARKTTGNPIENLQQGEQYEVDFTGIDPADQANLFKLKLHDEPVDLFPQDPARPLSMGQHFFGFEDESAQKSFDAETSVDSDQNTITFSGPHDFENGDAIVYRTDPSKGLTDQVVSGNVFELKNFEPSAGAIDDENDTITIADHGLADGERVFYESNGFDDVPGLVDGREYEVDLDSLPLEDRADKLKLIDPDHGTVVDIQSDTMPDGTHGLLKKTTSDSVVNIADRPVGGLEDGQVYNVIVVDDTTIRLIDSYPDALAGKAVDLTGTGAGTAHSLSQGLVGGIGIQAALDATNKAFGGPSVGGNPSWRDLRWNPELVPAVAKLFPWSGVDFAKDNNLGGQNSSKISLAGGLGLLKFDHDVLAKVGKTADLESGADVTVKATTNQKVQIRAAASITKPGDDTGTLGIGAGAVALGFYDNHVQAVIAGDGAGGAEVDAARAVNVNAILTYPLLSKPLDVLNPVEFFKGGLTGLATFLEGDLGLRRKLFNTSVMTSGSTKGTFSFAGGFSVADFTNFTEATIQNGARINQTDDSQEPTPTFRTGEQTVQVWARTEMNLVQTVGQFSLNLNETGLYNAFKKDGGNRGGLSKIVNPVGNKSGKGGLGGSFLLTFLDNDTIASVEAASVHTSEQGGLEIKAEEDIMSFSFAQSGGDAGTFGLSGSVAVVDQESTTHALITSGASVTGGPVDVDASDTMTHINIAGAIQTGKTIGIGASIAINDIDRDTAAFIGNEDGQAPGTAGTSIDVNDVTLEAESTGVLYTFSLSGSLITGGNGQGDPQGDGDEDPLDGVSLPALFGDAEGTPTDEDDPENPGEKKKSKGQGKTGIGIAGAVSINTITDNAQAYINDTGNFTAGALTLSSLNETGLRAVAGAAAVTTTQGLSGGIAGSFGKNTLEGKTKSYIIGATIHETHQLSLSAERTGDIFALTAGVGVTPRKKGIAIAGSVSLNKIDNETETFLDRVQATVVKSTDPLSGNVSLFSTDTSEMLVIAGSLSYGGKAGIGASVALNKIDNTTRAVVNESTLKHDGNLTLSAINDNEIKSAAAGIAASGGTLGGSGAVSLNFIDNTVEASISNTVNTGNPQDGGPVSLYAEDDSLIMSLAGAVGGAKTVGFGGSLAYNKIDNTVEAYVHDSSLNSAGSLIVHAESSATIKTISAGGGGAQTLALAGAVSLNKISNTIDARVSGASVINAAGTISIEAHDSSTIWAIAGNVAGAGKAALGASVGYNDVDNTVKAHIDGSSTSVTSTAGHVHLLADSSTDVRSIAAGGQGAGKVAIGGSVSINEYGNDVEAYLGQGVTVEAEGSVTVQAVDDADFLLIAGVINGAGTAAVGVANTTLVTDNTVKAYVGQDATVRAKGNGDAVSAFTGTKDGNGNKKTEPMRGLAVTATSYEKIRSFAVAGSGAGTAGVAGSAAVNVLDETTLAYVDQGAVINDNTQGANAGSNAAQDVNVLASAETEILSVAGGLAGGGTAGVGAGADVAVVNKETRAYLWASTVDARQDVKVRANSAEDFLSISVALGVGGTAGIAGSGGVYTVDNTTRAFIGDDPHDTIDLSGTTTTVVAEGSVLVSAVDDTEMDIIAGNISGGGTAGVGVAAGVTVVDKTTEAFLGPNADVTGKGGGSGVTTHTGQFAVGSVADSGSEDFGEVPAATITEVGQANDTIRFDEPHGFATGQAVIYTKGTSDVGIEGGGKLEDGQTYYVIAEDTDNTLDSATIKLAATDEDAHEGKAIDLAPSTLSGTHSLTDGIPSVPNGDVTAPGQQLQSGANTNFDNEGGNDLAPDEDTQTKQRTSVAGTQAGFKGVAVTAVNQDDIETIAISGGGAGTVAVNIGGSVCVITNNTSAYVAGGAKVNKDTDTTDGTTSDQSVLVAAGNDLYHMGIGGAISIAGTVAVTPGADVTVITNNTKAYVDDGALVKAEKDIAVVANSSEDVLSIAAGVGGSGTVGIGVAASVIVIDNTTYAYIGCTTGATASAGGNILVSATDTTETFVVAGSLGVGFGAAGIGGAASVAVINKDTRAFVGSYATVDAKGNGGYLTGILDGSNTAAGFGAEAQFRGLAVQAQSSEDLFAIGASAGGGFYAGLAGGVAVEVIDSDTQAYIGQGAQVNQDTENEHPGQAVNVSAANRLSVFALGGGLGLGAAGVAGGVDVGIIRNDTTAYIGDDAVVEARHDVDVNALSSKDIDSYAFSLGGGLVGISGSVSVWSIGSELKCKYSYEEKDQDTGQTSSQSDEPLKQNDLKYTLSSQDDKDSGKEGDPGAAFAANLLKYDATDQNGEEDDTPDNTQLLAAKTSEAAAHVDDNTSDTLLSDSTSGSSGTETAGTTAYVGVDATVHAGNDVNIRATDRLEFDVIVGSAALGGLSLGGSVAVLNVNSNVEAFISEKATVGAGHDVLVHAGSVEDLYGLGISGQISCCISLGAQVVVFNDNSTQKAFIGRPVDNEPDRATIDQAGGTVAVEAEADRTIKALAIGGGLSAGGSIGASVAIANAGGSTSAHVDDARIAQAGGTVGNVSVTAESVADVEAFTVAVAGGLTFGLSGSIALAEYNPSIEASITNDADVTAADDVSVESHSRADVDTDAYGVNVAGAAALGASVAIAKNEPTMTTAIGSAAVTAGGSVTLRSVHNYSDDPNNPIRLHQGAEAQATTASGALLLGAAGAYAEAETSAVVKTYVADDAQITAGTDVRLLSLVNSDAESDTSGVGGGLVGVGVSLAYATTSGSTSTYVGDADVTAGQNVEVTSRSHNEAYAESLAVAGGILSGSGNVSETTVDPSVDARIKGGATVTAEIAVLVDARAFVTGKTDTQGVSAGVLAVGVSEANSTVAPNVTACAGGDNTTITAGTLSVIAASSPVAGYSAQSRATGSSGGLIGVSATKSKAHSGGTVTAYVGQNSTLNVTGTAKIFAETSSKQNAVADGFSAGLVAAGANKATASSNSITKAFLGSGVTVTGGALEISATGTDDNLANSESGSGAIVSGAAASAKTQSTSITTAYVEDGPSAATIRVNDLTITADHTSKFDSKANSVNAALVGVSGAYADNSVNSTVEVNLGAQNDVEAENIVVEAINKTEKPESGYAVQSGSGGVIDAPAAESNTTINHSTSVMVGADAKLRLVGDPEQPGKFELTALNDVEAHDKAKLDSGGAIAIAKAASVIHSDQNDATVQIGPRAELTSVGDIDLAARTQTLIQTKADAKTYGLAGAAQGRAVSSMAAENKIVVQSDARLQAEGDVNLRAGRDAQGTPNEIDVSARTDLWNKTALPVKTSPQADAQINQSNTIEVQARAEIASVKNVNLIADKGNYTAFGKGIGKDLYRQLAQEILNGIGSIFGVKKISLEIHGGSTTVNADSSVTVDGTVRVGIRNEQYLTIAEAIPEGAGIQMTGNPKLDFTQDPSGPDTIQRFSGSWTAEGFRPGQLIVVSGTSANDNTYTIASVDEDIITLADDLASTEAHAPSPDLAIYVVASQQVPAAVEMTGSPELELTEGGANPDTITRSQGSWIADGFKEGTFIRFVGSSGNTDAYEIASVTDNVIELATTEDLADETLAAPQLEAVVAQTVLNAPVSVQNETLEFEAKRAQITRSAGSWTGDGFQVGDEITISGAGAAGNNKTVTIESIDGNVIRFAPGEDLVQEGASPASVTTPIEMTRSPGMTLTFDLADAINNVEAKITRSTGSWLDDRFSPGQTIAISGSANNNGSYTIASVSATVIELVEDLVQAEVDASPTLEATSLIETSGGPTLTFEARSDDNAEIHWSSGNWVAEGFRPDQTIQVSNSGSNNGTYTIATVNSTVIAIADDDLYDATSLSSSVLGADSLEKVETTGAVGLEFIPSSGGDPARIVRTSGSWGVDGFGRQTDGAFEQGPYSQFIKITGAADPANNGTYRTASVSPTVIEIEAAYDFSSSETTAPSGAHVLALDQDVVPRAIQATGAGPLQFTPADPQNGIPAAISRTSGSWIADGFEAGQFIRVDGSSSNDGTYQIKSVAETVIELEDDLPASGPATAGVQVSSVEVRPMAIIIEEQSGGVDDPVLTVEDLARNITDEIAYLQELKVEHAGNAAKIAIYNAQITQLEYQLVDLKLVADSDPGHPDNDLNNQVTATPITGYQVTYINVPQITARSADINVVGDVLVGSGQLQAPGDTTIKVVNHSPYYLRVGSSGPNPEDPRLWIPEEQGGHVTLNGVPVATCDEIDEQNVGAASATFSLIVTGENSAQPLIHVENTFDPEDSEDERFRDAAAPDIEIVGTVSNVNGTVSVQNNWGSIFIKTALTTFEADPGSNHLTCEDHGLTTGDGVWVSSTDALPGGLSEDVKYYVRYVSDDEIALHPTELDALEDTNAINIIDSGVGVHSLKTGEGRIVAKTVDIGAGRDVVIATDVAHTGGDPDAQWLDERQKNEALNAAVAAPDDTPPNPTDATDGMRAGGPVVAGNNVFITARILNINGLVQSGRPDRAFVLDTGWDAYIAAWAQANPDEQYYQLSTNKGAVVWGVVGGASPKIVEMSGVPTLTFRDQSPGNDTITRSQGSWIEDGLQAGMSVNVFGTASDNDGTYFIKSISPGTLTLSDSDDLADETVVVSASNIAARFNRDTGVIEVDSVAVEGGYMQLTGQIISTGMGQLRVVDGFGHIQVDNQTQYPIELKRLDTGASTPARVTGRPVLTFTDGGGLAPDTITRDSGSWFLNRFEAGQKVTISGSALNDGIYTVESLSQDGKVLALQGSGNLKNELTWSPDVVVAEIEVTGAPTLTLQDVSLAAGTKVLFWDDPHGPDLIVRSTGNWRDDGFREGQLITVSYSPENDGVYQIATISDDGTTLVLDEVSRLTGPPVWVDAVVTAADTIIRSEGSWAADGFKPGQVIALSGSQNGNDGLYEIGRVIDDEANNVHILELKQELPADESSTASPDLRVAGRLEVAGAPSLVLQQDAAGDTVTRSSGSWIEDGFREGQAITVTAPGFSQTCTIASLSDEVVTLAEGNVLPDMVVSSWNEGLEIRGERNDGIEGTIIITDIGGGIPRTVKYTRIGDEIQVTDVAGNPLPQPEGTTSRTTSYVIEDGLRYYWVRAQGKQNKITKYWIKKSWMGIDWAAKDPGEQPTQVWVEALGPIVQLNDGTYVGRETGNHTNDGYAYDFENVLLDRQVDIISRTETKGWWIFSTTYHHLWKITQDGFTNFHTHSVKADYPIAIEFTGYDTSSVIINSNKDVLLKGSIVSRNGPTVITSTDGAIEQVSDTAMIITRDISLSAANGIGDGEGGPIRVDLLSSTVDAVTGTGDVEIIELDGGVEIGTVSTPDGNVYITAESDIVAADENSKITGGLVELTSLTGGIGTADLPIVMDSGEAEDDGLRASAVGDVYLKEEHGDLLLISAESLAGNVTIEVADGSLLDHNTQQERDTRTETELLGLWNDARLTGDAADQSAEDSVTAFEQKKTQEYETYWQYRNVRAVDDGAGGIVYEADPYDASFQYRLPDDQRPYYEAEFEAQVREEHPDWTDQQVAEEVARRIEGFEDAKTEDFHRIHEELELQGLTDTYDPDYAFTASATEQTEVTDGFLWTVEELKNSIGLGLLKETSDTETRIEAPNAKGDDVTLIALAGGLGTTAGYVEFVFPVTDLTDDGKIALLAAEKDDLTFYDASGNPVDPSDPSAEKLVIALREDVDVEAGGVILVEAGGNVFLGSEKDLNIDQVLAGEKVRIKGAGGIFDMAVVGTTNVEATDLILEAATDSIGSSTDPLSIDLADDSTLTARSGKDIYVTEQAGALNVDAVFAKGNVWLTVHDGPGSGDDLLMGEESAIKAAGGWVTLQAGDDVRIEQGAWVQATAAVTIRGDHADADPASGSKIHVAGSIYGESVEITGGDDDDIVSLTNVIAETPTTVLTYAGNDTIHVGSNATAESNSGGTLNAIDGLLTIHGGLDDDQVRVDDSGEDQDNAGVLTAGKLLGLGMGPDPGAVDWALGIEYDEIEELWISLGSGSDTLDVLGTSAVTGLDAGAGGDTVTVGNTNEEFDKTSGTLDALQGDLYILPQTDSDTDDTVVDTLNVDDSGSVQPDVAAIVDLGGGQLNVSQPAGFVPATVEEFRQFATELAGFATATVFYYNGTGKDDAFEYVNVRDGRGDDEIEVYDTTAGIRTTLDSGDGDDTYYVTGSGLRADNLFFGGNANDTFNVYVDAATLGADLAIYGGDNDSGRRDVVNLHETADLTRTNLSATDQAPDGVIVGGLGVSLFAEEVETLRYDGGGNNDDRFQIIGNTGDNKITVAPTGPDSAVAFYDGEPFDGPPQDFATQLPGSASRPDLSGLPDLQLSGLTGAAGLAVSDLGGALNRVYVYARSENGLSDPNAEAAGDDPFGFGDGLLLPAVGAGKACDAIHVTDSAVRIASLLGVNINAS
ncbi:MAG TPA: hypothetical protein VM243_05950, partial [Phycisphaerae bacterium]|nr:hypothetical protein [Phycisphaerae bacterium]